ncbi:hypothetical protein [Flavobacterium beibuense]|uniref:hypothetical protein n=1 Tax=Flavobacterium beibuense TaxID=657326 RepID=UPI003A92509F
MATEETDWQSKEKAAAIKAVASLKRALNSSISKHFNSRSGQLRKSSVKDDIKDGMLDRLILKSPKYSFVLHHGYDAVEEVQPKNRKGSSVKPHFRGGTDGTSISGYQRSGGSVSGFKRSSKFEGAGHITEAIYASNVLETLANDLAESRAVYVTSNILPTWQRKV